MKNLIFLLICINCLCSVVSAADRFAPDDSTSADTLNQQKASFTVLPFAFYSPETKLAVGLLPSYIFRTSPDCRPSSISFPGYYTINKQISLALEPEFYLTDDLHYITAALGYEKWPDTFYGIGNDVPDDAEDFTSRNFRASAEYRRKTALDLYLGMSFDFASREFLETEEGGLLESGRFIGAENGYIMGAGLTAVWDNRDDIFFPGSGYYHQLSATYYGAGSAGDYEFKRYSLDLRGYRSLAENNVVAVQAYMESIYGDAPFWTLPRLGDKVRGYYPTKYIDKSLLTLQAEYRMHPLWRRWGVVLFAGIGSVARKIDSFEADDLRFAAGAGLRYKFVKTEKLNVRADLGFGGGSTQLYIAIDEAF